jgi:hypothetical protein
MYEGFDGAWHVPGSAPKTHSFANSRRPGTGWINPFTLFLNSREIVSTIL